MPLNFGWIYFWIFSKTSGFFQDVSYFYLHHFWSDIGSAKPSPPKKLAVSIGIQKSEQKHDIGWRGRMGHPISSDLLKYDNDTINSGCSLDDSNGLANCTTSPTVFCFSLLFSSDGKWSLLSCVCLRRGEQQKTSAFVKSL